MKLDPDVKKWLTTAAVSVVVVWLMCLGLVFLMAQLLPDRAITTYGAAGDMFGAGASLFAALGFLGVAAVLAFEMRERRRDLQHREADVLDRQRARRPYVWPDPDSEGTAIVTARWANGHFEVGLVSSLTLRNATGEPALNVGLETELQVNDVAVGGRVEIPGTPIASSGAVVARARYYASGQEAEDLIRALRQGQRVDASTKVRYASLNGQAWISEAWFDVACRREADQSVLSRILDESTGEAIAVADDQNPAAGQIFLEITPKMGRPWRQVSA